MDAQILSTSEEPKPSNTMDEYLARLGLRKMKSMPKFNFSIQNILKIFSDDSSVTRYISSDISSVIKTISLTLLSKRALLYYKSINPLNVRIPFDQYYIYRTIFTNSFNSSIGYKQEFKL